ncbi:MAG: hypothetical protein IJA62_03000 [Ruminococcus sp.]|nr:hypothetical protein [Ruminococcus sp.]
MKNDKFRCPYCSKKIGYGTRLLEHRKGEHNCNHCQKISNIKQDSYIWISLVLCIVFALFILIFYLSSAEHIQRVYDESGKMKFLVSLFFGNTMIIKWIIWEIIPFIIFHFVSPVFLRFTPQKRFMEQTQTKIDLSVPIVSSPSKSKVESRTQKIITNQTEFTGEYEDISSSSSDMSKTRSFSVSDSQNNEYMDVNKERTTKSQSYSSDAPLIRVSHEVATSAEEEDVKEYVPVKEKSHSQVKVSVQTDKSKSNYSANRKF